MKRIRDRLAEVGTHVPDCWCHVVTVGCCVSSAAGRPLRASDIQACDKRPWPWHMDRRCSRDTQAQLRARAKMPIHPTWCGGRNPIGAVWT